jgi:aromatase
MNHAITHETQSPSDVTFVDGLFIAATAEQVYRVLWDVQDWPNLLPHVRRITIKESGEDHHVFEMETQGAVGIQLSQSRRLGVPHRTITYEQFQPPPLFRHHRGVWTIEPAEGGVEVTSRHWVAIEESKIEETLGRPYSVADTCVLVRHFVGNHSAATLKTIKGLLEGDSQKVVKGS